MISFEQLLRATQEKSGPPSKLLLSQFHTLLGQHTDLCFEEKDLHTIGLICQYFNGEPLQDPDISTDSGLRDQLIDEPMTPQPRVQSCPITSRKQNMSGQQLCPQQLDNSGQDCCLAEKKQLKERRDQIDFHKSQLGTNQLNNKLISSQKIKELKERINEAYEEHRIDEAWQLVNELRKVDGSDPELQRGLYKTIGEEYQTVKFVDAKIKAEWQLKKNEGEDKLYMLQEEGAVGMKITSRQKIAIKDFLALICEVDLFTQYVPFCDKTRLISVPARNQRLGYAHIKMPVVADRQLIFYALGYNRLAHNGSLLFLSRTVQLEPQTISRLRAEKLVPALSEGHEWLDYRYYAVQFRPTGEWCQITICCCMDMHMNYVPMWIISMGVKQFAQEYFRNMMACTKDFTPWIKRIKAQPEFYRYFDDLIKAHGL